MTERRAFGDTPFQRHLLALSAEYDRVVSENSQLRMGTGWGWMGGIPVPVQMGKMDEKGDEISEHGGIQPHNISRLCFFEVFCKWM